MVKSQLLNGANFGKIQLLNGDNLGKTETKWRENSNSKKVSTLILYYCERSELKKGKFLVFCLLIWANFSKSQLLNMASFGKSQLIN